MKTASIAILLCLVAAANCQSHDLIIGQVSRGDVLLYQTDVAKHGFPYIVRSSIIDYYPEPEEYVNITAISVLDYDHDGSGGYPSISAGGVGERYVEIKLKSQRGHGLNFDIRIFGRHLLED